MPSFIGTLMTYETEILSFIFCNLYLGVSGCCSYHSMVPLPYTCIRLYSFSTFSVLCVRLLLPQPYSILPFSAILISLRCTLPLPIRYDSSVS